MILFNPTTNQVTYDVGHMDSREGDIYKLTINHLSRRELTNFSCKAQNEVGYKRGHIEVTGKNEEVIIFSYVFIFVTAGIPQPPTINSGPESLHSTQYKLVFTVKSFEPLTEVKVRYWKQVRNKR